MTNEEIYQNVMGHKPNKDFGVKGSFSWDDIDTLMNAVKNCCMHYGATEQEAIDDLLEKEEERKTRGELLEQLFDAEANDKQNQ